MAIAIGLEPVVIVLPATFVVRVIGVMVDAMPALPTYADHEVDASVTGPDIPESTAVLEVRVVTVDT